MGLNVGKNLVNQAQLKAQAQTVKEEVRVEQKEAKASEIQDKSGTVKVSALDVLANQNLGLIVPKPIEGNDDNNRTESKDHLGTGDFRDVKNPKDGDTIRDKDGKLFMFTKIYNEDGSCVGQTWIYIPNM